jgi:preprotein translocase subunit SecG
MIFIKTLFIVVEVLSCFLLIGLILLQKSKSEGLGLAFGAGAGESLFGARAGNVLSKATVVVGIAFMANTLFLGVLFAQKDKTLMEQAPATQPAAVQTQPIEAMDFSTQMEVTPDIEEIPVALDVTDETQEEM